MAARKDAEQEVAAAAAARQAALREERERKVAALDKQELNLKVIS